MREAQKLSLRGPPVEPKFVVRINKAMGAYDPTIINHPTSNQSERVNDSQSNLCIDPYHQKRVRRKSYHQYFKNKTLTQVPTIRNNSISMSEKVAEKYRNQLNSMLRSSMAKNPKRCISGMLLLIIHYVTNIFNFGSL